MKKIVNKLLALLVIAVSIMLLVVGTDAVFYKKTIGIGSVIFEGLICYGVGLLGILNAISLWNSKN